MAIERLWAPWRGTYVSRIAHASRPRCIFCLAKRSRHDRKHHVVRRGRYVFCLLNRYPYSNGHLMIAPYRHIGSFSNLQAHEALELWQMAALMERHLTALLHPHGFNMGVNVGRAAGAGIPGHMHFHVVPRWVGDTNFMPTVSGTKIISQSLAVLYEQLAHRTARNHS